MASTSDKVGHALAKGLLIKTDYRKDATTESLSRGESVFSTSNAETYIEKEPTAADYFREIAPNGQTVKRYFRDLFPFLNWITRYNLQWFTGDLIAGLTVGAVVVPQGMAYALLAKLPAEYGLYTSFVGFILYWAFATSKDITIGTVAVMSTLVGNIVIKVQKTHPDIDAVEIARTLAVVSGCVVLFIGLARIGWIVEWISLTAITAFMTGSAITIGVGQIPALLGIPGINNRGPAYEVFINTLKALPKARLDAAMGVTALFLLYFIRFGFEFLSRRYPSRKKTFFFLSTLRIAFVLLLYIMISWLVNRGIKDAKKAHFRILGKVPRGFQHAGAPKMNTRTINAFASELPATIIVLLIEHIAISKSFGRINNYTINPSQELVAIGFTNVFGPFLGAYPATGSFSRTAIKSKAGVRTPLAGVFTAIVVLLALYALTAVFFYIPMSSLAAVIIHAVGDLITPPNVVYQFWEVSPLEVPIFFIGVFVTLFTNIENGIYATIAASGALLLFRLSKAKGRFVGRTKVQSLSQDSFSKLEARNACSSDSEQSATLSQARDVFLPLDRKDGSNPDIQVKQPHPGVFIYRFNEGFNYPNSQHYMEHFTEHIFKETRRTTLDNYAKLGDRPWNDPGPRRGQPAEVRTHLPILRAVILDFSAVNNVDVSAVQNLVDVRKQLDRYASPATVGWHFANITSRWTRRALASAGFGYPKSNSPELNWKSIISIADFDDSVSTINSQEKPKYDVEHQTKDDEIRSDSAPHAAPAYEKTGANVTVTGKSVPLYGVNRPFFHVDIFAAVEAALAVVEQDEAQLAG
ncbi:sulfate transporter family-domain-containing protein [Leptodontidium sp. MPI-SDFR-AT-0119]|nr:sulfate transporter family-domain-containing protein [Leptodontidium sp. MPI-SDFR-AT-0119]